MIKLILIKMLFSCAHCKKQVRCSGAEFVGVREEDLGESWMNLMASALAPLKKENTLSNIHAEVERNRKVKEIAQSEPLDPAVPVCDSCTSRIVSELVESRNQAAKEAQMFSDELARLSFIADEADVNALGDLQVGGLAHVLQFADKLPRHPLLD